jgi:uncharacterized protein (TIGR02996 family)
MLTAGPNLMAAIIADSANDLWRLQYADWLEENGDEERAEFVRVQCELATLLPTCARQFGDDCQCGDCCRVDDLRRREREIGEKCCKQWIAELLSVK